MTAQIRRARPSDVAAVGDFLAHLSPETSFRRFLTGLGGPSARLIRRLVRNDADAGSWVAVEDHLIVGHGSWTLQPYGGSHERPVTLVERTAEIALVVADDWQRRGIGHELTEALVSDAAAQGCTSVRLEVHGDNRPMLQFIARRWPELPHRTEDGLVVVDLAIPSTAERRSA